MVLTLEAQHLGGSRTPNVGFLFFCNLQENGNLPQCSFFLSKVALRMIFSLKLV